MTRVCSSASNFFGRNWNECDVASDDNELQGVVPIPSARAYEAPGWPRVPDTPLRKIATSVPLSMNPSFFVSVLFGAKDFPRASRARQALVIDVQRDLYRGLPGRVYDFSEIADASMEDDLALRERGLGG